MFLNIFVVSAVGMVFPAAANMSKKDGSMVKCTPVGVFPAVERNMLRSQVV